MPRFRDAGPEARQRLLQTSKGFQQRQIYRDNLTGLGEGQYRELQPARCQRAWHQHQVR